MKVETTLPSEKEARILQFPKDECLASLISDKHGQIEEIQKQANSYRRIIMSYCFVDRLMPDTNRGTERREIDKGGKWLVDFNGLDEIELMSLIRGDYRK